jgi:hypothetical protein
VPFGTDHVFAYAHGVEQVACFDELIDKFWNSVDIGSFSGNRIFKRTPVYSAMFPVAAKGSHSRVIIFQGSSDLFNFTRLSVSLAAIMPSLLPALACNDGSIVRPVRVPCKDSVFPRSRRSHGMNNNRE